MFESKRRALIFMILSFILAVIGGMLFYSKYQDLNADLGKMTKVYVTGKNIASRQTIEASDVSSVEIPNKYVTDAHILSLDQLEDQVSIIPLKEGDLITNNILRPYTELTTKTNRLVEILSESDNVHFDDEFDYLDRVDIIVSHSLDKEEADDEPVTELFMSDVQVQKVFENEEGQSGIAVEVKSENAPRLIHMQNYADYIRVLKAGAGEDEIEESEEVDGNELDDEEITEEESSEGDESEKSEEEKEESKDKSKEEKDKDDEKDDK